MGVAWRSVRGSFGRQCLFRPWVGTHLVLAFSGLGPLRGWRALVAAVAQFVGLVRAAGGQAPVRWCLVRPGGPAKVGFGRLGRWGIAFF